MYFKFVVIVEWQEIDILFYWYFVLLTMLAKIVSWDPGLGPGKKSTLIRVKNQPVKNQLVKNKLVKNNLVKNELVKNQS